jgi:hypothetical protein
MSDGFLLADTDALLSSFLKEEVPCHQSPSLHSFIFPTVMSKERKCGLEI